MIMIIIMIIIMMIIIIIVIIIIIMFFKYFFNYKIIFYILANTIKIGQKSIAHETRRRVNDWNSIKVYCS